MDEDCLIEAAMAAMVSTFQPQAQLQLLPLAPHRPPLSTPNETAQQQLQTSTQPRRRLVLIKKGQKAIDCNGNNNEQDLQDRSECALLESDFVYRCSSAREAKQMCAITFPPNLFQYGLALWMPPKLFHTLDSSGEGFLGDVRILSREEGEMKYLWKCGGPTMLISPSLSPVGVAAELSSSSSAQPMVFVCVGPAPTARGTSLRWTVVSPANVFESGPQQLLDIVTNMNSEGSRRKANAEPLDPQDGSTEQIVPFGSQEYLELVARRQVASMLQRASSVSKQLLHDVDGDVDVAAMRRDYPALMLIRKESLEGEVFPQMVAMCGSGRLVSINSGRDVRVDRQWFGCKTLISSLISQDDLSKLSSVEAAALHAARQFGDLSNSADAKELKPSAAGKFATSFDKTMNILKSIDVVSNFMSPRCSEALIRTVLALACCGFPYLITTARGQSVLSGASYLDKLLSSCAPAVLWYFLFHPTGKNTSEAEDFCILCGAATSLRPSPGMTSRSATKKIVEVAERVTRAIRCHGDSQQIEGRFNLELDASLLHMYQSIAPGKESVAKENEAGSECELKEIDLSFDDEEMPDNGPPLPRYIVQRCKSSGAVKIIADRREIKAIMQRFAGKLPKPVSTGPCPYCQFSLGHKLCECPAFVANICRLRQGLRVLPAMRRDDTLAGGDSTDHLEHEECDGNVVIQLDVPTAPDNKKRRRKETLKHVESVAVAAVEEKKREAAEVIRDTGVMLRTRSKAIDRRLAQRRNSIWVDMLSEAFNHIPNSILALPTKSKIVGLVSLMSGETAEEWQRTVEDITRAHCGIDNDVIVSGIFATFRDEVEKNRKELNKLGFELQ